MKRQAEEMTVEEYRKSLDQNKASGRRKSKRAASMPRPASEPRTPNGWQADYDQAGRLGWQFTQNGYTCYAWKTTGEETARYPLLVYASAAGTLRRAVEAALAEEEGRL